MFDPFPSLEHSFVPLPDNVILHALNTQKPKRLSSKKNSTCKYTIEDNPYVFKFMSEEQAYNHHYNSEIYRLLSIPIHTNRIFSFQPEQLGGFLKRNSKIWNKLIRFFSGISQIEMSGVYAPFIPGNHPKGNEVSAKYKNELGNEYTAALCVAQAYDTRYHNIVVADDQKRYVIDPEFGIMSFRNLDLSNTPSSTIRIPEIGTVNFKQAPQDIENTALSYQVYANNARHPAVAQLIMRNSLDIIKKVHTANSPILDQFQDMRERLIGCALWVYDKTQKIHHH